MIKLKCVPQVDTFNHRLRLVDMKTHRVRTLAGSGRKGLKDGEPNVAEFHNPGQS